MLAEVALALGVLDRHPRRGHLVADPADQRLDPRRAEQRVVDVVEVGRLEIAVGLLPGVLVGVLEDDELELGAGVGDPGRARQAGRAGGAGSGAARRRPRCRRPTGGRRAASPCPRARARGAACRGRGPSRSRRSRAPTRPSRSRRRSPCRRRRRAGSCSPRRRARARRRGSARGQALALQPPLHVGDREQHGVDRAIRDRLLELVERHPGDVTDGRRWLVPFRRQRLVDVDVRVWPVKWCLASATQAIAANTSTAPTVSGA